VVIVGQALGDGFGLDLGRLTHRANVHLLGMKGRGALPGYLKAFDVCLIPYLINDFTRSIYPLKLHEYMASGKPIVTTRIPACEEYRDVMRIAETPEEFLAHVMAALREDDAEMRRRRMQIAQENSWERRVQEKSRLIEEHLGRG
jgi:glycosyltransferase involved in cell wall biosynthesis